MQHNKKIKNKNLQYFHLPLIHHYTTIHLFISVFTYNTEYLLLLRLIGVDAVPVAVPVNYFSRLRLVVCCKLGAFAQLHKGGILGAHGPTTEVWSERGGFQRRVEFG